MTHDAQLHCRLPSDMRDKLDELHERSRIPLSELVRHFIEIGYTSYLPRHKPGKIDLDALVLDVAEDMHDRQREAEASGRPRSGANAAA